MGGARIIDRVAHALRGITNELLLAANDPGADAWLPGVPVARDTRAMAGGLAGIEAALAFDRDLVVVAWDMPFVTQGLLRTIVGEARRTHADAVLPRSDSPFGAEPFCAFYAARTRESLRRFLDAGGRAAHEFIAGLPNVLVLDPGAVALDTQWLFSVNTATDLARARAIAESAE